MTERLPRRLAAIFYADVAGYSRLTGEDEDRTHKRLGAALDLFERTINAGGGEIMHYAGDAVLARFGAVIDAMTCALAIQKQLDNDNSSIAVDQQLQFRIGINLGDVIEDRGDIYGDGVNIAARLEALADPGGICVSESVRAALGNRLNLQFNSLGDQQVKNIAEPVRAYKIHQEGKLKPTKTAIQSDIDEPLRPSIAVLPFTNMSGDPEQEYFSDGITEDIITALSSITGLKVIARNSSMIYKNRAVDIKQVGMEQAVGYVLEGSVRKSGTRVRVTAQLIDAKTGHHLWADRYDRNLDDIFAVQDDITHKIMIEMRVKLSLGEKARILAGRTHSAAAWELQLKADEFGNRFIREYNHEARELANKAISIDSEYVSAWTELGWTHCLDALCGWYDSFDESITAASSAANTALDLEPDYPTALCLLGYVKTLTGSYDEAVRLTEKAVSLAPENTECIAELGHMLLYAGDAPQATQLIERVIKLTPMEAMWHHTVLGLCHLVRKDLNASIEVLHKAIDLEPDSTYPRTYLVSALHESGQIEESQQVVSEILQIERTFSLSKWKADCFSDTEIRVQIRSNLRQAGLPE